MEKIFSRLRVNCGAYTTDSAELRDFTNGDFLNKCPICGEYDVIERKNIITKSK